MLYSVQLYILRFTTTKQVEVLKTVSQEKCWSICFGMKVSVSLHQKRGGSSAATSFGVNFNYLLCAHIPFIIISTHGVDIHIFQSRTKL